MSCRIVTETGNLQVTIINELQFKAPLLSQLTTITNEINFIVLYSCSEVGRFVIYHSTKQKIFKVYLNGFTINNYLKVTSKSLVQLKHLARV